MSDYTREEILDRKIEVGDVVRFKEKYKSCYANSAYSEKRAVVIERTSGQYPIKVRLTGSTFKGRILLALPKWLRVIEVNDEEVFDEGIEDDNYSEVRNNNKPVLKTLTSAMKRFFSPSLQSQYRAGLRNDDLTLTQAGREELLELLAKDKETDFTTRANEIISAAKDKDND